MMRVLGARKALRAAAAAFRTTLRYATKLVMYVLVEFLALVLAKDEAVIAVGSSRNSYTCNPRYLFEHLCRHGRLRPFWITGSFTLYRRLKREHLPVRMRWSPGALRVIVRASAVLFNHGVSDVYPAIARRTTAINLFHGSPVKRMGLDSKAAIDRPRVPTLVRRLLPFVIQSRWDAIVAAHPRFAPFFMSCLGVPADRVITTGLPRNDLLAYCADHPEKAVDIRSRVCRALRTDPGARTVLYAPTFRDYPVAADDPNLEQAVRAIMDGSDGATIFLRLHPYDRRKLRSLIDGNPNLRDASRCEDIQELYLASDMLVTDYSSVMFDFMVVQRPVILYVYDVERYRAERGFYIDVENGLPFFTVAKDPGALRSRIREARDRPHAPYPWRDYNLPDASKRMTRLLEERLLRSNR